jgi:hypothetical protein
MLLGFDAELLEVVISPLRSPTPLLEVGHDVPGESMMTADGTDPIGLQEVALVVGAAMRDRTQPFDEWLLARPVEMFEIKLTSYAAHVCDSGRVPALVGSGATRLSCVAVLLAFDTRTRGCGTSAITPNDGDVVPSASS